MPLMDLSPKYLQKLVLSRQEVRNCDRVAIERYQINGLVLMENAGSAAARLILSALGTERTGRVCIIAGTGNNGGDGFVVARHLANIGVSVEVIICGDRARIKGDALSNLVIIEHMKMPIYYVKSETPSKIADLIRQRAEPADLIVDAMLGTGAAGPPREPFRTAIETINSLDKPVIALDIPSGLDCDTGQPLEAAVRANQTVTFAAMKKGFLEPAAIYYTGEVTVASIGIDTRLLQQ